MFLTMTGELLILTRVVVHFCLLSIGEGMCFAWRTSIWPTNCSMTLVLMQFSQKVPVSLSQTWTSRRKPLWKLGGSQSCTSSKSSFWKPWSSTVRARKTLSVLSQGNWVSCSLVCGVLVRQMLNHLLFPWPSGHRAETRHVQLAQVCFCLQGEKVCLSQILILYVFVACRRPGTSTCPTNSSHAVVVLLRSLRWGLAELAGGCMLPNAGTWSVQCSTIE